MHAGEFVPLNVLRLIKPHGKWPSTFVSMPSLPSPSATVSFPAVVPLYMVYEVVLATIKYLELEGRRRDWKRGSTYRITLPIIQMVLRFIIYNEQIRVMNI